MLSVLEQAYGPQSGYPTSLGAPLSTDALYYGNPAGSSYTSSFYGSRAPFGNQSFNPQSLAYSLPMIMNGLTGGYSNYGGGPFGYGSYGGGPLGYGGYGNGPLGYGGYGNGILPLAMGLGGLLGGARGFRLGSLFGLGSMALFGLGRLFRNRFNNGGGWDRGPQPRPMPYDGNDCNVRPKPDGSDNAGEEAKLIALINQARGDNKTLQSNSGLQQAAGFMALQMQGKNLNHNLTEPGMESVRTPADRIATIGKLKAGATGECLAQGTSAKQVFDMLMADPPHRAILLSGAYNSIGVKRVGNTWVLDFAKV